MALEALSSNELLNFIMYDSIIGVCNDDTSADATVALAPQEIAAHRSYSFQPEAPAERPAAVQGRKKRRRRPRVCKNKEEAETQRMTHIAVERNRRKQMNEHLAVLRSLMPESYVQRGDQASIVGGAIDFVKELEHTLQSLEAKKHKLIHQQNTKISPKKLETDTQNTSTNPFYSTPFAQFFTYPQFSCTGGGVSTSTGQLSSKYTCQSKAAIADIEVTLIETHANIRILSRKRVRQLSKIVAAFHSVCFTILHLNVTTLDSLVLYSISAKVEEGCQLNSADDIASAVHHMLRIIEEEAISYVVN